MVGIAASANVYCFGCYVLDANRAVLLGPDGTELALRPKAFDVLRFLVENPGRVVSRTELLDAVWPGLHVTEDGITQCVREVRLALGNDAHQLVRTVAKRGYMLVPHAASHASSEDPGGKFSPPEIGSQLKPFHIQGASVAPRLSLVVLPFANIGGDPGHDYLADAVTDELTSELSRCEDAFVIGRASAQIYRERTVDVRRIGPELGVRYAVLGTVRRVAAGRVRINAEVTSTESGATIWSERFEQDLKELADGEGSITRMIAEALGTCLVDLEGERSIRERADDPDALDLLLRAQAVRQVSLNAAIEAQRMLEGALALSPRSVRAMVSLAYCLMAQNDTFEQWDDRNTRRAQELLRSAEILQPAALSVVALRGAMLLWNGRYAEGSEVYQRVLARDPNNVTAHHQIGAAKLWTGDPEAALVHYQEALRRDPVSPLVWFRYAVIGYALLLAQRPWEGAEWLRRAVMENPGRDTELSLRTRAFLASAHALNGDAGLARAEVAAIARLAPAWTARSWDMRQWERSPLGEQLRYVSDGLEAAGLRGAAPEGDDTGFPSTRDLHDKAVGPTPSRAPGVTTLLTDELERMIAEDVPVLLDVNSARVTIPGAVTLALQFVGGTLDDEVQDRLRSELDRILGGDANRLVVVFGWNSERWSARNAALRVAALGYPRVCWYRGGKESWMAKGLPTVAPG